MINRNLAKLELPRSMDRMNSTFNVDVLSPDVPNPEKFLSRRIPKSSKLVSNEPSNRSQIVEKLLRNVSLMDNTNGLSNGIVKPNMKQLGSVNGIFTTSSVGKSLLSTSNADNKG